MNKYNVTYYLVIIAYFYQNFHMYFTKYNNSNGMPIALELFPQELGILPISRDFSKEMCFIIVCFVKHETVYPSIK